MSPSYVASIKCKTNVVKMQNEDKGWIKALLEIIYSTWEDMNWFTHKECNRRRMMQDAGDRLQECRLLSKNKIKVLFKADA